MPTPRPHADKATLFFSDSSMRCWYRENSRHQWEEVTDPCFLDSEQYHVGHQPPGRTIKVGSREINAPLDVAPANGAN